MPDGTPSVPSQAPRARRGRLIDPRSDPSEPAATEGPEAGLAGIACTYPNRGQRAHRLRGNKMPVSRSYSSNERVTRASSRPSHVKYWWHGEPRRIMASTISIQSIHPSAELVQQKTGPPTPLLFSSRTLSLRGSRTACTINDSISIERHPTAVAKSSTTASPDARSSNNRRTAIKCSCFPVATMIVGPYAPS